MNLINEHTNTVIEEYENGDQRDESQSAGGSLVDWNWSIDSFDIPDDEIDHRGDEQIPVVSGRSWDIAGDLSMDDLVDQNDSKISRDLFQKSLSSALGHLPDPRKERKKALRQVKLKTVSEDDYDSPTERKLVRLMRLRAQAILKKEDGFQEYLRWYFMPGAENGSEGIEFESCAIYLGVDPQAIRLRMQSYLYRYWIVLSEPIGFLVSPPPEDVISRGIYIAGSLAEPILRAAWEWPGIPIAALLKIAQERKFDPKVAVAVIEHLLESRIMLEQMDNCYVVGEYGRWLERKNPWKY